MSRVAVIVQMRLDSSRLPRKALLPLIGTTLAGAVFRRLSRIPADDYVLACDEASAGALGPIAERAGFAVSPGPKEDVLARYTLAIERYRPELVVRATGDNPLVSYELARQLLDFSRERACDYAGHTGMPHGMGVEVVRAEALLRANRESADAYEREHVCPYLYRRPELFRVEKPACPPGWALPHGRVTVDTEEDYRHVVSLFGMLGSDPDDRALIALLRREAGLSESGDPR